MEGNDKSITGYELSKAWFDWCYENPEKISVTHTAMYFFIIEHWNRMGQKKKFGLPTEMTKDALGIKNYKTFANAFNDLIDWGFLEVHQRSKNQFSANIVALVKNTKATTNALTKATLKQAAKQRESNYQRIVGVDKPNNLITLEPKTTRGEEGEAEKTWKNSFEIYKQELNEEYQKLLSDSEFIENRQKYFPEVNIQLSLEKAVEDFWGTEAGWENKKSKRIARPNWKQTLAKAIEHNKVYYPKRNGSNGAIQSGNRPGQILRPESQKAAEALLKHYQDLEDGN